MSETSKSRAFDAIPGHLPLRGYEIQELRDNCQEAIDAAVKERTEEIVKWLRDEAERDETDVDAHMGAVLDEYAENIECKFGVKP